MYAIENLRKSGQFGIRLLCLGVRSALRRGEAAILCGLIALSAASAAQAGVVYDHWSPFSVSETITDLGSGWYQYSYAFTNTDTSVIWHFQVYTDFMPSNPVKFAERPNWSLYGPDSIQSMVGQYACYDARNLDLNIGWKTNTCGWGPPSQSIGIGEAVSSFGFKAQGYDDSPKYFLYETLASGWAVQNGTGIVAAVGLTPEPATMSLLALGGLAVLGRRMRK